MPDASSAAAAHAGGGLAINPWATGAAVGLGAIGGFMQYDATKQRQRAETQVNNQYQDLINARSAQVAANNMGNLQRAYGAAGQNLGNVQQGFQAYSGAADPWNQNTSGLLSNIHQAQAGMPQGQALNAGQQQWGQAAAQQIAPVQTAHLGPLSQAWQAHQTAMQRGAAQTDQQIRQLSLSREHANADERAAIDQQIQALAFQRNQQQLQIAANRAQQKGGEQAAWGGMLAGLGGPAAGIVGALTREKPGQAQGQAQGQAPAGTSSPGTSL
jgi:hypothetical protein